MRTDGEDFIEVPPWACILNQYVGMHGFLRYRDTDFCPEWLKSKKSGTTGFPSLTRRKPVFFGYVLFF